jgi:hypothetical protein
VLDNPVIPPHPAKVTQLRAWAKEQIGPQARSLKKDALLQLWNQHHRDQLEKEAREADIARLGHTQLLNTVNELRRVIKLDEITRLPRGPDPVERGLGYQNQYTVLVHASHLQILDGEDLLAEACLTRNAYEFHLRIRQGLYSEWRNPD